MIVRTPPAGVKRNRVRTARLSVCATIPLAGDSHAAISRPKARILVCGKIRENWMAIEDLMSFDEQLR
jgi:hypothetical protein